MQTISNNPGNSLQDEEALFHKYVIDSSFRAQVRQLATAGDRYWMRWLKRHVGIRVYTPEEIREINRMYDKGELNLNDPKLLKED